MRPLRIPIPLTLLLLALPARADAQQVVPTGDLPLTVAEASDYTRTAAYRDVYDWFEQLQRLGARFTVRRIGTTTEGRAIPLVIVSRPLVSTPEEARASGKPIIYLQGNIHAGEVEGKDALLMLLRDLTLGDARDLLDDLVLLINPIYNADGNEQWGPVERNRRGQDGPQEVGLRPNGMGLDLNRDCMKAESPEFRAAVEHILNPWMPDLVMDLHTTNGSYHGYDLTYAASLTPTALPGTAEYTDQKLLPEIRRRLAERGHPIFDYGNHGGGNPPTRWSTFGWEPRYVSNYNGLRGSISILSEAVSYRPFRTRLSATYWFVREILAYAGEHAAELRQVVDASHRQVVAWGRDPSMAPGLGVKFRMASRGKEPVTYEVLEGAAGGRGRGTRTGRIETAPMEVFTRFEATLSRPFPAGYLIPMAYPEAVETLRLHGIQVERLAEPWTGEALAYRPDSLVVQGAYQGHRMVETGGSWATQSVTLPAGTWWVPTGQPLGVLAFMLLEPECDDSLYAWNFFDRGFSPRGTAPTFKVMTVPALPRRAVGGGR